MAELKLSQCSKADLLWIIKRMTALGQDYYLEKALNDLWYEKEKQRLNEADRYAKQADKKRREYIALLSPYDGKRFSEIPLHILEKADAAMKEAQAAEAKWNKLMGI